MCDCDYDAQTSKEISLKLDAIAEILGYELRIKSGGLFEPDECEIKPLQEEK